MSEVATVDAAPSERAIPIGTPQGGQLASLVAALSEASNGLGRNASKCRNRQALPSQDAVIEIVDALRTVLFPGYFGPSDLTDESLEFHIGSTLDRIRRDLRQQLKRGICFACTEPEADCDARAEAATQRFLERLPSLRHVLASDVQAAYNGDPAATSPDEAIFCYPGLMAVIHYRLAHELHLQGVPLIPRMITEHAHSITGIDIHPGATIGEGFFIDHGTGVVIGETCVIGDRVTLYQGVTLGAKSFPLDEDGNPIKGIDRHPIVEDDVIIYSEATILGRVTIGHGAVIGGNVWLTRDVAPYSVVTQAQVQYELFDSGAGI